MKLKRTVFLLLVLLLLVPHTAGATGGYNYYIYHVHTPGNPASWVPVTRYLVSSGCEGCQCGSNWVPNTIDRNLFEKPSDRAQRGLGVGDANPPSDLDVWDGRASCSSGVLAAGTWYHNGYFTLNWDPAQCRWDPRHFGPDEGAFVCDIYGHWDGPSSQGWNFAEDMGKCPTGDTRHTQRPTPVSSTTTPVPVCSGSWYEHIPPTMNFRYEPPYPVVAGQDPDRRGIDLFITGTEGKVVHHYRHLDVVGRHNRCIHSDRPRADWNGCDLDMDGDGNPDHPGDPHWNEASVPVYACRWHTQEWDNPVVAVDVDLQLTGESREWIQGELRQKYPGARVQGTYPWPIRWDKETKGTEVDYRARKVPLPDPGKYRVVVTFTLQDGRTLQTVYRFPMYLLGDTLIK